MAEKRKASEAYLAKLRDPRWQKKRLEVLQRDEFTCKGCLSTTQTLHVHHRYYQAGKEPWEAPMDALVTLCEDCHERETEEMPAVLHDLNLILKQKGFLSEDIHLIATGFIQLEMTSTPSDMAICVSEALRNKAILDQTLKAVYGHQNG